MNHTNYIEQWLDWDRTNPAFLYRFRVLEDKIRHLFRHKRTSNLLKDDSAQHLLIDLLSAPAKNPKLWNPPFAQFTGTVFRDEGIDNNTTQYPSPVPIENLSRDRYLLNLHLLTDDLLSDVNWEGMVMVGGISTAALMSTQDDFKIQRNIWRSDVWNTLPITICFHGLTDEQMDDRVEELHAMLMRKCIQGEINRIDTREKIILIPHKPYRRIVIERYRYLSIFEILVSRTLDCRAIAFDGTRLLVSPRGHQALLYGLNVINPQLRKGTNYEIHLARWVRRGIGFIIDLPDGELIPTIDNNRSPGCKLIQNLSDYEFPEPRTGTESDNFHSFTWRLNNHKFHGEMSMEKWAWGMVQTDDHTDLLRHIREGNLDNVKKIMGTAPQWGLTSDPGNLYPIHHAILSGNTDMVTLVRRYPCAEQLSVIGIETIHFAARFGTPNIMETIYDDDRILHQKLDRRCQRYGLTPFHYALITENYSTCDFIIAKQKKFPITANGQTPEMIAIKLRNPRIMRYLMSRGLGTEWINKALLEFCRHNIDISPFLESGVNVNVRDNEGRTALEFMVEHFMRGNTDLQKLIQLLDRGAKATAGVIHRLIHRPDILSIVCRYRYADINAEVEDVTITTKLHEELKFADKHLIELNNLPHWLRLSDHENIVKKASNKVDKLKENLDVVLSLGGSGSHHSIHTFVPLVHGDNMKKIKEFISKPFEIDPHFEITLRYSLIDPELEDVLILPVVALLNTDNGGDLLVQLISKVIIESESHLLGAVRHLVTADRYEDLEKLLPLIPDNILLECFQIALRVPNRIKFAEKIRSRIPNSVSEIAPEDVCVLPPLSITYLLSEANYPLSKITNSLSAQQLIPRDCSHPLEHVNVLRHFGVVVDSDLRLMLYSTDNFSDKLAQVFPIENEIEYAKTLETLLRTDRVNAALYLLDNNFYDKHMSDWIMPAFGIKVVVEWLIDNNKLEPYCDALGPLERRERMLDIINIGVDPNKFVEMLGVEVRGADSCLDRLVDSRFSMVSMSNSQSIEIFPDLPLESRRVISFKQSSKSLD